MSHIDSLLTDEAKAAVIRARIVKLAQEGYQVVLNKKFAEKLGNAEDTEKFTKAADAVEVALAFHIEELNALGATLSEVTSTIEE